MVVSLEKESFGIVMVPPSRGGGDAVREEGCETVVVSSESSDKDARSWSIVLSRRRRSRSRWEEGIVNASMAALPYRTRVWASAERQQL
jgi:hypothetical protein